MLRAPLVSTLIVVLLAVTGYADALLIRAPPTLQLGSATLTGAWGLLGAEAYRGIPFALPPTGERRFMPPVKAPPLIDRFDATRTPKACQQMLTQGANATGTPNLLTDTLTTFFNSPLYSGIYQTLGRLVGLSGIKFFDSSEDCLYLNVVRPAGTRAGDKLPIVVFFYGGAFLFGDLSLYDPSALIKRSVDMQQPLIHVTMNYRLGAYGWLPLGGGNMGLLDQRMVLEWVQEHAEQLGGDKKKVVIWGESAGAFSSGFHLVSEGTTSTSLFRGIIMESGSAYRIPRLEDPHKGQAIMGAFTGCDRAPESMLKCLQKKTTREIDAAQQQVPGTASWTAPFPWQPAVDGKLIPAQPYKLLKAGRFKRNVAILSGCNDDEGTFLTLGTIINVTKEADFKEFSKDSLGTTDEQYARLAELYPSDPAAGSPYNTGLLNQLTPQSKRVASLYGDKTFVMTRKLLLREVAKYNPNVYSYTYRGFKFTPFLGSFHISELLNTYGLAVGSRLTDDMQSRWVNFINHLTPDAPNSQPKWPKYGTQRQILAFDELSTKVELDNQRDPQHAFLEQLINV